MRAHRPRRFCINTTREHHCGLVPGWLSHPTEVPDRARFPTNLARNLTRSLLSTTRKRWNCNDAISISEIVREELRATLLGNHVRSYTSQGPTRRRVLHTTGRITGASDRRQVQPATRTALRASLGVRGHVGQQTRIVSAIAPIGGISHGTRARVLGAHTVFPRGRQTLVNEVAVHLRDEARDAAPSTRRRRITHWGFPDRPTQPPPRHEQRPQALCDAQRCRAPRQTGNRVA